MGVGALAFCSAASCLCCGSTLALSASTFFISEQIEETEDKSRKVKASERFLWFPFRTYSFCVGASPSVSWNLPFLGVKHEPQSLVSFVVDSPTYQERTSAFL